MAEEFQDIDSRSRRLLFPLVSVCRWEDICIRIERRRPRREKIARRMYPRLMPECGENQKRIPLEINVKETRPDVVLSLASQNQKHDLHATRKEGANIRLRD